MQGACEKKTLLSFLTGKNVATFLFVKKKLFNIFVSGVRVQIVAVSYATRIIDAANQNRRKFTSHNYYGTRNATRKPEPQRRPERNTPRILMPVRGEVMCARLKEATTYTTHTIKNFRPATSATPK